ncbi:tRNA (N(6)-L-threonylcarbamoyladenosine(37)-C(2))-methylthiotransferase MtaB [Aureimonas jatrophae]|uniref:Threonylcarbamoyladenosine tRNA methylthiotransferase MtaB n=1 Tax=Aureimonas jatrophae TaxID=1166073 RepID=A0A1H0BYS5_9HYPH|nr:tRNA (N(6)-L-threonylcarbamoyladenosine(37)-C(2))-methylthiotransferase MtaB [Aureimonas jatrophae]MBB3948991.1 threonylcarbamoyladenosine tRNA methylthiotransferase MtaB [Aureimonas jatrophae]SDN50755.1 threonylcarbamoyladenosine tRNA methylthiotransferase MtaB [Aureimonas jatrophae]
MTRSSPVEVHDFGCRLNTLEGEVIRRTAQGASGEPLVVVNTCAVTSEAVRQARQSVRRLRRLHPNARLVVTGCAAQTEGAAFAAMPEVDAVIGNDAKLRSETWATLSHFGPSEKLRIDDLASVRETAGHMVEAIENRARAILQIQNGCDHRCTFCIIPFGRGPSRSVPAGEIVRQARRIAEGGVAEIVLTGVDLTSWGADLPGAPKLGNLVSQILRLVPDLPRLRLSSIDQIEADPLLVELICGEPRLMPHLHLSLQSGDDMVLKRMKRRHTRDDALRFCREVLDRRPEIVIGADLIAGFPTETDAMAEATERFVGEAGLTRLHVFPYSARPGTPAARMPPVPGPVIRERAMRLRAIGAAAERRHVARLDGARLPVLVERGGRGRCPDFTSVQIAAGLPGAIVDATLSLQSGGELHAAPLSAASGPLIGP